MGICVEVARGVGSAALDSAGTLPVAILRIPVVEEDVGECSLSALSVLRRPAVVSILVQRRYASAAVNEPNAMIEMISIK